MGTSESKITLLHRKCRKVTISLLITVTCMLNLVSFHHGVAGVEESMFGGDEVSYLTPVDPELGPPVPLRSGTDY